MPKVASLPVRTAQQQVKRVVVSPDGSHALAELYSAWAYPLSIVEPVTVSAGPLKILPTEGPAVIVVLPPEADQVTFMDELALWLLSR